MVLPALISERRDADSDLLLPLVRSGSHRFPARGINTDWRLARIHAMPPYLRLMASRSGRENGIVSVMFARRPRNTRWTISVVFLLSISPVSTPQNDITYRRLARDIFR